jgi:hypothetical protein
MPVEGRVNRFDAGARFLEAARNADIHDGVQSDVVSASMLMDRGIVPGPHLGQLLARCREIQDETGSGNAAHIVERVLRESGVD